MVQSFLWLQQNKDRDNPGKARQDLARIVSQNFRRRNHTGRKIIQWERSWIASQVIPETKAGSHKHNTTWMEDEDLIMSIKEWAKGLQDGMYCSGNNIYLI